MTTVHYKTNLRKRVQGKVRLLSLHYHATYEFFLNGRRGGTFDRFQRECFCGGKIRGLHLRHMRTQAYTFFTQRRQVKIYFDAIFSPLFSIKYILCLNAFTLQYSLIYFPFFSCSTKEFIYVDRKECKRWIVVLFSIQFLMQREYYQLHNKWKLLPTFLLYLHFPFPTLVRPWRGFNKVEFTAYNPRCVGAWNWIWKFLGPQASEWLSWANLW